MINQLNNSINRNVIVPFKSSSDTNYAVSKPLNILQKDDGQEDNKPKKRKVGILGAGIAGTALAAGVGVFLLTRGRSKKLALRFNQFSKFIEEKVSDSGFLRGIKRVLNASRAIFTTAALKDVGAKKILEKLHLQKVEKFITNLFEKVSIRTSTKAYEKASNRYKVMRADLLEAQKKIAGDAKGNEAQRLIKNMDEIHDQHFGLESQRQRLSDMKTDMANMYDQVWDSTWRNFGKFVKKRTTYTTFLSEELAAGSKAKLHAKIMPFKESITLSTKDNYHSMKKLVGEIDLFSVNSSHESRNASRNIINNLKDELKKYSETGKQEHKDSILTSLKKLNENVPNKDQKEKFAKEIERLSTNKSGKLQEIMAIYKGKLPSEDCAKLEKSVGKFMKSFNKAVDSEDKLFDKVRDFIIGSAPKDTLAVLASLGFVGWGLAKAKDDDERTSTALREGIPVVGAIVTALYFTTKLISSGPSLILGLISGAAINRVGVAADDMRKKYEKNPPTLASVEKKIEQDINPQ